MLPRTRFVDSDGCSIAYQVLCDGRDLLYVPGLASHLDLQWSDPWFADSLQRLASFSRLIIFDQRGIGLSDPAPGIPRLEQRSLGLVRAAEKFDHRRGFKFSTYATWEVWPGSMRGHRAGREWRGRWIADGMPWRGVGKPPVE